MENIKYDSVFTQAIEDKLEEIGFSIGYLHQDKHPNVIEKARKIPVNGATISRILNPKKSIVSDKSLYLLMEWCGIKSIQLSYEDDMGTTLKTLSLK